MWAHLILADLLLLELLNLLLDRKLVLLTLVNLPLIQRVAAVQRLSALGVACHLLGARQLLLRLSVSVVERTMVLVLRVHDAFVWRVFADLIQ